MMCPVCRRDRDLNHEGNFALHRVPNKDRYTFCPMSGQPVPADDGSGDVRDGPPGADVSPAPRDHPRDRLLGVGRGMATS